MNMHRNAVKPIAKSICNGASFGRFPLSCAKKVKNGIFIPECDKTPAEAKTKASQIYV